MTRATVLFVDDEPHVLEGLRLGLRRADYRLLFATGATEALDALRREPVDVVVSDQRMPEMTGIELLSTVRDRHPDTIRILLTGHADAAATVDAINRGEIYRFLAKPCDPLELEVTLHLACDKLELERRNRKLLALIRTNPELERRLEAEVAIRTRALS